MQIKVSFWLMMKGEKTGPNISLSHVIKSFILSLPPVFDMLVTFFSFIVVQY